MKPKPFIKVLYSVIWTGIFLLSSIIIVKGSSLMGRSIEEKVNQCMNHFGKKLSIDILDNSSPFLCYSRTKIDEPRKTLVECFLDNFSLLAYLNTEMVPNTILEYDNDTLDISSMISETDHEEKRNDIPIIIGEGYHEKLCEADMKKKHSSDKKVQMMLNKIKQTGDTSLLLKYLYTVDSTTSVDKSMFPVNQMLKRDFSVHKSKKPQILIFHTHGASESFADSKNGKKEDSIIGVGSSLKKILEEEYGYVVIHDETPYDKIQGRIDRNKAYNKSLEGVSDILEKNPSIEVIIDLHRDGVGNSKKKLTTINGKPTAQFMLFNGLSRNRSGPISYLKNPNLKDNLAFGLQVKWKAMELYPDLTVSNYLKGYRYNMHLRGRYLLIELGNQNNTVEEAKNAMKPLAEVLSEVLKE